MLNTQTASALDKFYQDFAGLLNRSGGITEIAEAPIGTSRFSDARYLEQVSPDILRGLAQEQKNFAFVHGLTDMPDLKIGAVISRRSTDKNVQQKNLLSLDTDLKEMIPGFLDKPPQEKRAIAYGFFMQVYPNIVKGFGDIYAVVFSGNGLHFHLKLNQPLDCSDKDQFDCGYHALVDRFEQMCGGELAFDRSLCHPGRLIRVPLTVNWKNKEKPVQTEIFHFNPDADSSESVHALWDVADMLAKQDQELKKERSKAPADSHKEAVRQALDFQKLLEHFGYQKFSTMEYSKNKNTFVCSSPFKTDKTPSCYFDEDRKIFKDFSSGHGGDAFTLIGLYKNLNPKTDFGKIMKIAEDITGLKRPNVVPLKADQEISHKKREPEYEDYAALFEKHLPGNEKDIFSRMVMVKNDMGHWVPVVNKLGVLRSYAIDTKFLKKNDVEDHLARYEDLKKPAKLLADIPEWDGLDRIKTLASCLEIDNCTTDEAEQLIKGWGARMFQRLENPYIQNKMIILKGPQGVGKDTFINAMLEGLGQFSSDLHITEGKDMQLALSSRMVFRISEFDRASKISVEALKDIITKASTDVRGPWKHAAEMRVCRCSFISSVNVDEILRDHTGNRRYIIFALTGIRREYPLDQSPQVLAQFRQLAEEGFEPAKEAVDKMDTYIAEKTPEDPKWLILEDFDERMAAFERDKPLFKGLFPFREVSELIKDVAQTHKMNPQKLQGLLKDNDRFKKTSNARLYFRAAKKPQ